MKKIIPFLLLILAGCSDKPTLPYVILKVEKSTNGAKMDVQLYGRITKPQMVAIASKIKKDSSQYENLQIDYLLPGNSLKNVGGITVYATAAYHETRKLTATDTVTDLHDNKLSFEFVGFTPEEAKKLLALDPQDITGKTILGKFIDDFTRTVSIVYKDSKNEDQIYILELDPDGKIVSATEPLEVTHNGVQKLIISPKGDYCTLKNDTLTMYSIDDPERPYRSLKADI